MAENNDKPSYTRLLLIAALAGSGSGMIPGFVTQEKVAEMIHHHAEEHDSYEDKRHELLDKKLNECYSSVDRLNRLTNDLSLSSGKCIMLYQSLKDKVNK